MMEPSRVHELNKIAGEFCGKILTDEGGVWLYTTTLSGVPHYRKWNPADDHNDAAEVKAKLREKFIRYSMRMIFLCSGEVFHQWELEGLGGFTCGGGDESELIALLLAVEALGKP